ncbi:MAG TPA: T9SS type A sorting domain-containing protein [Perlabentimonas sp.]|nr:T9SS type A sorting domain-containing protein [Perlabentimonas sp.]
MITLSQSQDIVAGSVACGSEGITSENSYYRAFDLANDFEITNDWIVSKVDLAVESAISASGETQPVWLKLHTASSTDLSTATLTLLYEEEFAIANTETVIVPLELAVPTTVPAGAILAVEIFSDDLGNTFYIGSNGGGQDGLSYLRAPACGIEVPTPTGDIGFPNMHIVLNVWGDADGTNSAPVSQLSEVNAYPNPFTDKISISNAKVERVVIYNLIGQEVMNARVNGNTVDTSELLGGVYVVSFEGDGERVIRKMIKQ